MNDNVLTPDIAFSSLALFHQITGPLVLLPYILNLSVNLNISVKRLTKFLTTSEVQPVEDMKTVSTGSSPERHHEDGDRRSRIELERRRTSTLPVLPECEGEDECDVFEVTLCQKRNLEIGLHKDLNHNNALDDLWIQRFHPIKFKFKFIQSFHKTRNSQ